jgi:hypothetical protein
VLAFDAGLGRLYSQRNPAQLRYCKRAIATFANLVSSICFTHTVSVDPKSHLGYLPLENVDGHPLLRIMQPVQ